METLNNALTLASQNSKKFKFLVFNQLNKQKPYHQLKLAPPK